MKEADTRFGFLYYLIPAGLVVAGIASAFCEPPRSAVRSGMTVAHPGGEWYVVGPDPDASDHWIVESNDLSFSVTEDDIEHLIKTGRPHGVADLKVR